MKDENKIKEHPIKKLTKSHQKPAELSPKEIECKQDGDALKEAHENAEREKAKLEAIIAAMGDGLAILDIDFKVLYQNDVHKNIIGDHIGEYCYQAFAGSDHVCEECPLTMTLKDGEVHKAERTGGNGIHVEVTASPLRDPAGNITACIMVVRDITERKKTEESLRKSEEKFRTIADFTYDWEYWIDPAGNHLYISPSCERITGYSADEFKADPELLLTITHPDDRPKLAEHLKNDIKNNKEFHIDFRIITRSGEERWIAHSCQPVYDADGNHLGRRASNRDITKRKAAEHEIQHYSQTQTILNKLLGLSLKDMALQNILEKFIDYITSFPWLGLEPSGVVFLVEEEPDILVLKAHKNVLDGLLASCAQVPFGKCLCRQVASSCKVIFADRVIELHEIVYNDISPHGHYCVPIHSVERDSRCFCRVSGRGVPPG